MRPGCDTTAANRCDFHGTGNTQEDYLAWLCAVHRARTELPAAGAEHEAAQAAAKARRLVPPPMLLAWLKTQPPSATQTGLHAAGGCCKWGARVECSGGSSTPMKCKLAR